MIFTDRIRKAAKSLAQYNARDLADKMGVQTYAERHKISSYIQDFVKRGEMKRVSRGVYKYVVMAPKTTFRQRLWNVIRRRPGPYFTLDDLERLTGANRATIKEFCTFLVREGYAERIKYWNFRRIGTYPPEAPKDKRNIERLRKKLKTAKKKG